MGAHMPDFHEMEWIANTPEVRARVNTLKPSQGTPWHFHTTVTDTVFCIEEGLEIWLRDPDERISLKPGGRHDVAPRRVHRVVNTTARALPYLLIQATGAYDFVEVK
jgi:quercetin dioxygenase-like cupin family protein